MPRPDGSHQIDLPVQQLDTVLLTKYTGFDHELILVRTEMPAFELLLSGSANRTIRLVGHDAPLTSQDNEAPDQARKGVAIRQAQPTRKARPPNGVTAPRTLTPVREST